MCIVFCIIERVYWYLRVTLSSMIVSESSYVNFLRSSSLCIHFSVSFFFLERDEWPSLRGFGLLSFPSLHSLLTWLHFILWFELITISLYMFIVSSSSSSLLLIHPFHFTSLFFAYIDLFQVCYPLCIIFTHLIISSICFIYLFLDIIFTLGTFRSIAHELFHTCCILYMRAWVLIIGYLGLVFLHFYYPIILAYVMSHVLRPPWGHGIRCCLRQPLLG